MRTKFYEITGKYNTAKVFTNVIENEAVEQIKTLCNQEFITGSKIRIMPDVHSGAGCTIGTTMTITDKVIPNLVGVDIGCGMETVMITDKEIDLEKLDKLIYEKIPSGHNIRKIPHELINEIDLNQLRCTGHVKMDRAIRSIGTLGGGNHFIEAGKDEEGNIYITVHSGSRHLGLEVANYYQKMGYKALNKVSDIDIEKIIEQLKNEGREKEINKFQIMAAKKVKIDLEDRIINRLNNFRRELHKKINIQDKELMKEMSKESHELRAELKAVAEKADIFIENSRKKALEAGISLGEESSVFHSEIQKEYDLKEDKYLYEKEKKNFVLEKLIGLKGFNFLGIISIFLGIFLVFKTQFRDFFNNDYIKSSGSYLLGIIFLFAGERLYQKKKKHFAVGLIGGGIGILYITTLLSTMYLGLFSMVLGLFISVILTGLVVVLALRYSSQIIGVLALIGGYLPYGAYIYYEGGITKIYYLMALMQAIMSILQLVQVKR